MTTTPNPYPATTIRLNGTRWAELVDNVYADGSRLLLWGDVSHPHEAQVTVEGDLEPGAQIAVVEISTGDRIPATVA